MKTVLILALASALVGVIVASLVIPPALAWYTAPGGLPQGTQIQALVQIPDVIRYATGRLIRRGAWLRPGYLSQPPRGQIVHDLYDRRHDAADSGVGLLYADRLCYARGP
jgi:hypothetical protein